MSYDPNMLLKEKKSGKTEEGLECVVADISSTLLVANQPSTKTL